MPALALLLACGALAACRSGESGGLRPPLSLLLVTLDTTRRDYTSPYGAPAAYSPALARLAAQGAVLEAVAQADVTNASHVSMMTGLPALEHGIFNNLVPLPPDLDALPQAFLRAGYATAAFVSIAHLGETPGWQGFDVLDTATKDERLARDTAARARAWLRAAPKDRPFFLWVHFFDPHWVYAPPQEIVAQLYSGDPSVGDAPWLTAQPWSEHPENLGFLGTVRDLAYVRALYAGEIRTMDDALGGLLDELEASGRADRTAVVAVGDHGESLGEHRIFFDHVGIYEPQLRIPLVVRVPGWPAGIRPQGMATHVDLAPTFAELFPIALRHPLGGRSLVPALRDGAAIEPRALVSEHANNKQVALRKGDLKLILPIWWRGASEAPELYDLRADPGETVNLAAARPDAVAEMSAELGPWRDRGRVVPPRAKDIDPEKAERLRALGYLR